MVLARRAWLLWMELLDEAGGGVAVTFADGAPAARVGVFWDVRDSTESSVKTATEGMLSQARFHSVELAQNVRWSVSQGGILPPYMAFTGTVEQCQARCVDSGSCAGFARLRSVAGSALDGKCWLVDSKSQFSDVGRCARPPARPKPPPTKTR